MSHDMTVEARGPVGLMAEDLDASILATLNSLRARGQRVLKARTILEGRRVIEQGNVRWVTIDQRMPYDDAGEEDATGEQIDAFARLVGSKVGCFLWLTANEVSADRMEIHGCIGVVQKAGNVTDEVIKLLEHEIPDLRPRGDEILVEVTYTEERVYDVQVPAWKPESFELDGELLPDWLRRQAERLSPRPVYAKARAWLGARRPGQLDLRDYEMVQAGPIADSEIWDE
jgi:hypothetical protein